MRLRLTRTLGRLCLLVMAGIFAGAANLSHASNHKPRLGLAPALAELPDGSILEVPGPHILLDGTAYVSAQRKRIFEALYSGATQKTRQRGWTTNMLLPSSGFLEILVNDPLYDSPGLGETQNEPTIAAVGDTLVCAFNDSKGIFFTNESISAFAYSLDGGVTWNDGGSIPISGVSGPSEMLIGEAALVTDGIGRWFYVSLYDVGNGTTGRSSGDWGLAVSVGRFLNGVLGWGPPMLFAGGLTTGSDLGLTHAAYDASADHLYVTFTDFSYPLMGWGQVAVVTLADHATQVLYSVVLQAEVFEVNNGGSQVAVGPNGEVHVAWGSNLLDGYGQGLATHQIVRSLDGGATFSPAVTAAEVVESWGSNPPGAGRVKVNPAFPALAVDTHPGANQGRVYLAWQDGVQMVFADSAVTVNETASSNNTPQDAQVLADSLTDVWMIGSLLNGDPTDFYRFSADAGEHLRIATSVKSGLLSTRLRVWCSNPVGGGVDTLLSESALGIQRPSYALITLPYTGDYFIELKRESYYGNYEAWIRRTKVTLPSVAIDHRDIVVASSADGVSGWTTKVRVNDDTEPADQSWPNIAVDEAGVHVSWYDRRFDRRCRALADLVLASSLDAGAHWTSNLRLTTESSWWQLSKETIPSYGDHARMASANGRLHVPWTDGRLGTPDIRSSALTTGVGLDVPDTIMAIEGQYLGLGIGLQAGVAEGDTFSVWVTAGCNSVLPDTTWMVTGLEPLSSTTLTYNPFVSGDIVNVVPCSLWVEAWSLQTDTHVQRTIPVSADGLIPVSLQDFTSSWSQDGVLLRWRAFATNRFEAQRSLTAQGPWASLDAEVTVQSVGDSWFELRDPTAPLESTVWYRLVRMDADGSRQTSGPYAVSTQAPVRVRLLAAQPNPFNPNTMIPFEMPRRGHATLRVLDARGRQVTTLADRVYDAGRHSVVWNGRLSSGAASASGVYFAELRAEGRRSYTRLILIR